MTDTTHSLFHAYGNSLTADATLFTNTTAGTLGIFVWDYNMDLCLASNTSAPSTGTVLLRVGTAEIDALRLYVGVNGHVWGGKSMNGRGAEYQLLAGASIVLHPTGVNSNFVSYSASMALDYIAQ